MLLLIQPLPFVTQPLKNYSHSKLVLAVKLSVHLRILHYPDSIFDSKKHFLLS
jgi:hypothetical protein